MDAQGNLYVPDQQGYNVRKITASTGIITTVAGTGSAGFSGDGGPATAAQLGGPSAVAFDRAGNMYIADTYGNRVRMVAAGTGIISTVAGNGTSGYVADGVLATTTELNNPLGVAVDAAGNIYIGDTSNHRIRKVSASTGLISTVAGNGSPGYSGDNGQAASAGLNYPSGIALDPQANLSVADRLNNVIRKVDLSTGIITTVAGAGNAAYSGDNGLATDGDLNFPFSLAFDPDGNLFIADYLNNVIRRVNSTRNVFFPDTPVGSSSAVVTLPLLINSSSLQITGLSVPVSQGGVQEYAVTSDSCSLNSPLAMGTICVVTLTFSPGYPGFRGIPLIVVTSAGTFRFALTGTGLGPQIGFTPAQIVTAVGAFPGTVGFSGDGGPATAAELSFPNGTVSDFAGNLYIADASNWVVRRVDATTGFISTYAGVPSQSGSTGDGGPATAAKLYYSYGPELDSVGNLYIADHGNHAVRKIDAITGTITTVAGMVTSFGSSGDGGAATSARLHYPNALALDAGGNLYIADAGNSAIRKVDAATGVITTLAGTPGSSGYSGDNGPATGARLNNPADVKLDSAGNIYIDDNANNVIRKVTASSGIITTVAGIQGSGGFSGDGGAATSALLKHPYGLALDAANNLYIADAGNSVMREVNALTGIVESVAGIPGSAGGYSGDGGPATAAAMHIPSLPSLDSAGALYISDYANTVVRRVGGPPALSFVATNVSASSAAQDVTITNNGTAALTFTAIAPAADFNVSGADTTCAATTSLAVARSCVLGIVFAPATTGSHSEILTLVDNQGTQTISLSGTGLTITQTITFTAPATHPVGGTLALSATATSGLTITYASTTTSVCTVSGATATFLTLGSCTLTANQAGSAAYSAALTVTQTIMVTEPAAYTAPASPVGTTTATQTAYVTITTPGLVNAINVLTLGIANLDYKLVTGGTCVTGITYISGQYCTVMYSFTPGFPGQRRGAITMTDPAGALLGVSYLAGLGNGPLAVFSGNQQLSTVSNGFTTPHGVVVDASGNLFVPDTTTNSVYEVAAGTSTAVPLAVTNGNFSQPSGIALDGAGNLFVADTGNQAIKEIIASGGYVTVNTLPVPALTFSGAQGVAVDGSGNVFVADGFHNAVEEVTAASGYTAAVILAPNTANLNAPQGLVVDDEGNVFVADSSNGLVKELLAPDYNTVHTLGSGFAFPLGVAVDASGNVYVSEAGNGAIEEIVAAGGYVTVNTLAGGFPNNGVGLDAAGNVYFVQNAIHGIQKLALTTAPSLSFTTTAVGLTSSDSPKTVAVANNGNAPLVFSALAPSSANFSLTGSVCSVSGPVAPGFNCNFALSFTPQSVGMLAGAGVLTDNSLVPATVQSISLSGTATIGSQTLTFSTPGPQGFGAPLTLIATASSGLVVIYVSSTPSVCTVAGGTVTFVNTGSCSITASQPGNANYTAAASITRTFTVAPGTPTISFTVATQTLGGQPFTVMATSNSAGAITYSVVSGPATISGATVTLNGLGTVVLLASQAAAGNFIAGSQTASFTVTPGAPVVTATISPANPVYGQAATITVTETVSGSPVLGATATVTVAGQAYTCPTSASGVCTVTVPGGVMGGGSNNVAVTTAAIGSVTAGAFQFSVIVGPVPTTLTLGSSSTQVTVTNPVTLTATVTSATRGTPTGTVLFYANSVSIGSGTVIAGVASLTLSTLAAGANAISATYGGDANFLTSMASGFTQTVLVNFTVSSGSGSGSLPPVQTVTPGSTAVFPLSLGIIDGFVGPVTMSATNLPPGATATFAPDIVQLDGIHPGTTTLSVATAKTQAQAVPGASPTGSRLRYGWVLLPMLALAGLRKRRRMPLLLLGVCGLGLSGCGSGGYFGAAPTSYVITVTASSGVLQHSTTVTLTIQ